MKKVVLLPVLAALAVAFPASGLAIVKRLVSADGGESQLLPAPAGGLDAVIRLRAASLPRPQAGEEDVEYGQRTPRAIS